MRNKILVKVDHVLNFPSSTCDCPFILSANRSSCWLMKSPSTVNCSMWELVSLWLSLYFQCWLLDCTATGPSLTHSPTAVNCSIWEITSWWPSLYFQCCLLECTVTGLSLTHSPAPVKLLYMRNNLLVTIPLFSVLAAGVHCNWSLTDSLSNSSKLS